MNKADLFKEMVKYAQEHYGLDQNKAWILAQAWETSLSNATGKRKRKSAGLLYKPSEGIVEVWLPAGSSLDPKELADKYLIEHNIEGTLEPHTDPYVGLPQTGFYPYKINKNKPRKISKEDLKALLDSLEDED